LPIPAGPDYSIPAGPGRYSPGPGWIIFIVGRITPLPGKNSPPPVYLFIRHQLQLLVPVLGCLQARTGTSSIIVCWSWDAPWLRPAYPSSPSQSYPQEEDKTDDMVILKTDARRRSQGRQVQTSMGLAHDRDAVHSTEDGTMLMQATVLTRPSSQLSNSACALCSRVSLVPWAPYIRGTMGNDHPSLPRRLTSSSLHGSSLFPVALAL
jgi:hypothetical protein